jgi:pyruvate dehydrogenase E2 component (dihydrolipoamide acetyltransferase)
MAYEFKLPDIGEGVVEGEVVKWLVNEGDAVAEDQPMVEVMTDKATVTIPSPKKGRILKRFVAEGAVAKVHHALVSIEVGESAPAAAAPAPAANVEAPVPAVPAAAPVAAAPAAAAPAPKVVEASNAKVLATPVTRRIAREHGFDLSELEGSGPQGRVLKKDVLAALETRSAPAAAPADPAGRRRCTHIRRTQIRDAHLAQA